MCPNPPAKLEKRSNSILSAYNKTIISEIGIIRFQCKYNQNTGSVEKFFSNDTNGPAIFGLSNYRNLQIKTRHSKIEETKIKIIQSVNDLIYLPHPR